MYGEHLPTGRPNSVPLNPLFYRTTRMDTTAPTVRLDAEGFDLETRVSPVCGIKIRKTISRFGAGDWENTFSFEG